MWWSDPNDGRVKAALEARCGLCGAGVGVQCHSITQYPLNRPVHIFRLEPGYCIRCGIPHKQGECKR